MRRLYLFLYFFFLLKRRGDRKIKYSLRLNKGRRTSLSRALDCCSRPVFSIGYSIIKTEKFKTCQKCLLTLPYFNKVHLWNTNDERLEHNKQKSTSKFFYISAEFDRLSCFFVLIKNQYFDFSVLVYPISHINLSYFSEASWQLWFERQDLKCYKSLKIWH